MPSDARAQRGDAITAVPGIKVGHYTDRRRATGCTVILCEQGAAPGFFNPGGAPGTIETDLARPENAVQQVHAVLLTGGSGFGLEAATGVRRRLREQNIGLRLRSGLPAIPLVLGAVVFDLGIGEPANPTAANGRNAVDRARADTVLQGSVGVGTGCTVAKLGPPGTAVKGGFGTAAAHHESSGLIVGAAVAANAVGGIVDPADGRLVAGPRAGPNSEMLRSSGIMRAKLYADYVSEFAAQAAAQPTARPADQPGANTTLAVVATNARLHKGQTRRLAIMASAGLARTIEAVFSPADGDSIFSLATGEIDISAAPPLLTLLGVMAADAAAEAALRSVRCAAPLDGVPSAAECAPSG